MEDNEEKSVREDKETDEKKEKESSPETPTKRRSSVVGIVLDHHTRTEEEENQAFAVEASMTDVGVLSKLKRAIKKSLILKKFGDSADQLVGHLAGDVVTFDCVENKEVSTLYIRDDLKIVELKKELKESFKYDREVILGTAVIDPNNEWLDQIEMLETFRPITSDEEFRSILRDWNRGAPLRRQRKVLGITRTLKGLLQDTDSKENLQDCLTGLAMLFELVTLPANIFAVDNFLVEKLVDLMGAVMDLPPIAIPEGDAETQGIAGGRIRSGTQTPSISQVSTERPPNSRRDSVQGYDGKMTLKSQGDPRVAAKAALICWRLSGYGEFIKRMVLYGTHKSSLSNVSLLAEVLRRQGHLNDSGMRELHCHSMGLLNMLLCLKDVRKETVPKLDDLLALATYSIPDEASLKDEDTQHESESQDLGIRLSAEAILLVLSHSLNARRIYATQGGVERIPELLSSPNVWVRFAGAGALHAFTREAEDRLLLRGEESAKALYALFDLMDWCMEELTNRPSGRRSVPGQVSQNKLIAQLLDQATAAAWGCATVVANDNGWASMESDRWLNIVRGVTLTEDIHVSKEAKTSTTGVLSILASGLAEHLNKDKTFLHDILEVLECPDNPLKVREHSAFVIAKMMAAGAGKQTRKALQKGVLGRILNMLDKGYTAAKSNAFHHPDLMSPVLEKSLACSMMFLCSEIEDPWSKDDMEVVVTCLTSTHKWVLVYATVALWCLARDPQNRSLLGDLWVVEGIVSVLKANSDLQLKEYCVGALWLISCDDKNAVRVSMKGGLQLVAAMCQFPPDGAYMALKTLCVGLLFHLWERQDLRPLLGCLELTPPLLQCVKAPNANSFLKILSAGLVFCLCEDKETRAEFEREGGKNILEDIFSAMVCSSSVELQTVGVFGVTALSLVPKSKRVIAKNGGVDGLIKLLKSPDIAEDLREKVLHAMLNTSTDSFSQLIMCKKALRTLVRCTRRGSPRIMEFSSSILSNMLTNVQCRRIMYKEQLHQQSKLVSSTIASQAAQMLEFEMEEPSGSPATSRSPRSPRAHDPSPRASSSNRKQLRRQDSDSTKERFESWIDDLKGNPKQTPKTRRGMRSMLLQSKSDLRAKTKQTSRRNSNNSKYSKGGSSISDHGGDPAMFQRPHTVYSQSEGSLPHLARNTTMSSLDATPDPLTLLRVRRKIRLPVSVIWDDTAEFYSTNRAHFEAGRLRKGKNGMIDPNTSLDNSRGPFEGPLANSPVYQAVSSRKLLKRIADTPSNVPLPGSHRIGPAGPLGSVDNAIGEDRWRPYVTRLERLDATDDTNTKSEEQAMADADGGDASLLSPVGGGFNTSRELQSTRPESATQQEEGLHRSLPKINPIQVELDPKGFYNTFNFHKPAKEVNLDKYQPVTLCKFQHVPGCSLCSDLYEHYVAEDGTSMHFYHTSDIRCEALDPGPYPRPAEPLTLEQILQDSLPPTPMPVEPQGECGRPQLYVPAHTSCPRIKEHAIPLCMEACEQAHGKDKCPHVQCNMFGVIPIRPLKLYAQQEEEIQEEPEEIVIEEQAPWKIHESIFAPRIKESEAHDFVDTDKHVARALRIDWERMLKEDRVWVLMKKQHKKVKEEGMDPKDGLEELKKIFLKEYRRVLSAFDYYCVVSGLVGSGAFSIQQNQFLSFIQDCNIPDERISIERITQIFVAVNFESDKGTLEADINEDRALMRFEFMECLIRIAALKYEGVLEYLDDMIKKLIEEHLIKYLPPEAQHDRDDFREKRLYTRECDDVYRKHEIIINLIYRRYSMLKPLSGKPVFGLEEWFQLLEDTSILGGQVIKASLRDARLAFFFCRTVIADEIKKRFQLSTLTKIEYYEALGRLADSISIPTEQDLKTIHAPDIIEYCFQVTRAPMEMQSQLLTRRESAGMLKYQSNGPMFQSRPLHVKIDILLRYIIGMLGLQTKGYLKVEKKNINLVSAGYITSEQQQRGPF